VPTYVGKVEGPRQGQSQVISPYLHVILAARTLIIILEAKAHRHVSNSHDQRRPELHPCPQAPGFRYGMIWLDHSGLTGFVCAVFRDASNIATRLDRRGCCRTDRVSREPLLSVMVYGRFRNFRYISAEIEGSSVACNPSWCVSPSQQIMKSAKDEQSYIIEKSH
jgi:hypothetical protein